jgi:hypothetical protein
MGSGSLPLPLPLPLLGTVAAHGIVLGPSVRYGRVFLVTRPEPGTVGCFAFVDAVCCATNTACQWLTLEYDEFVTGAVTPLTCRGHDGRATLSRISVGQELRVTIDLGSAMATDRMAVAETVAGTRPSSGPFRSTSQQKEFLTSGRVCDVGNLPFVNLTRCNVARVARWGSV